MKIRKKLRFLYRALRKQVNDFLEINHHHESFFIKGTGCMLCRLLEFRYPLAVLQLARENGFALNWFPAELELLNLLGRLHYKKKVKREMFIIKNMPQKRCETCGGTVVVFMSLSLLAERLLQNQKKEWYVDCQECGVMVHFDKTDIPVKLL